MTQAAGYYEPSLSHVFLPGCRNCGGKHPKTRGLDTDTCPDCGEPVDAPSAPVTVRALLTGLKPSTLIARFYLWAGRSLATLAKGL